MLDRKDKLYLTPAEKLIMRIIWLADHELVLNEILRAANEDYAKAWKPQTVSTYLSHLVQKGYLSMEREGKYCKYSPLVSLKVYLSYDIRNFAEFWGLDAQALEEAVYQDSIKSKETERKLIHHV